MLSLLKITLLSLISILLLSGCGSHQAAKQLATTTSLNTAILSNQLQQLNIQHQQLTQMRVEQIAHLRYRINEVRIRNELDMALMQTTNRTGVQTYEELEDWLETVNGILQQENDLETFKQSLAAELTPLQNKSQSLTLVAKKLAELAKDKKLTVRAKFYADFISEVSKEVKAGLEDSSPAVQPGTSSATLNTVMLKPLNAQ